MLFALISKGFANEDTLTIQPFSIIERTHYGFIVPHRDGLSNLLTNHTKMIEISLDKKTFGAKKWERDYSNPSYGISFLFLDMGNPIHLGYGIGLLPYVNYPVFTKEKFQFNIRVGFGAIYATKPFRQSENKNIIYGSNINALVSFTGEAKIKLSDKIAVHPGIAFTHFSNGAYELPNLGLNSTSVNFGVSYKLNHQTKLTILDSIARFKPYIEISASGGFGSKEIEPGGSRYYFGAGNVELAARISPMSQFYVGVDEFYNTSVKPRMETQLNTTLTNAEILQTGFVLGYYLKMNRLQIGVAWGTYLYTKTVIDKRFYHKLTNLYYITDKIFAKFVLKTHFVKADYFEFGLGYKIWKSR
ncbi:MAG: acyloxyacyl hydrolase [Flavobacteriales bacterium]|nr:acyloxyacyl hydrolase [Flavobacteriales bacterium]